MATKKVAPEPFVSLGLQAISWVETLLCHGPGDVEGLPIELDDEFAAVFLRAYRLHPNGRRKLTKYTLSRAKGRAKSELAGMIGCVELLGPARFHHWAAKGETSWWGYEFEKGEPVGAPVTAPFLRCLATEESQTGNTYANIRTMLEKGSISLEIPGMDIGETRTYVQGLSGHDPRGECRPSTASGAAKDGGKETWRCADETHLYVTPELGAMYQTVERNMRKRKIAEPWGFDTTTAHKIGAGSVAEQMMAGGATPTHYIDHVQGIERMSDLDLRGLTPEALMADPVRIRKTKQWRQLIEQLHKTYGAFSTVMDLDSIVEEEFIPHIKDKTLSAQYFLNLSAAEISTRGWLKDNPGAWGECHAPHLEMLPTGVTWAGVDGSLNRDSTAVGWVQLVDGRLVTRIKVWKANGGQIPYDEVRAFLRELGDLYDLRSIAYDTRYFNESANELADEGLPMIEVPQSLERMTPICGRATEAILSGQLAHDNDPEFTQHVSNAAKKLNERGFTFSKVKSGALIDGWIAACLAIGEATADSNAKKKKSVYEERGLAEV
jgi:Phage Terminase